MSQGNDDLLSQLVSAFNAHDVEGVVTLTSPDCVIVAQRSELEGAFRGHEGVRRWVGGYFDAVPDVQVSVERAVEASDGRMVILGRQMGTAKLGGAPFDAPLAMVAAAEAGRLTSLTAYPSYDQALAATGLQGSPARG